MEKTVGKNLDEKNEKNDTINSNIGVDCDEKFDTMMVCRQNLVGKNLTSVDEKNDTIPNAKNEITPTKTDTVMVCRQNLVGKNLDKFCDFFDTINDNNSCDTSECSDTDSVCRQNLVGKNLTKVGKHTCSYCNYHTNDLTDYKKHLNTKKHKTKQLKCEASLSYTRPFKCDCGKSYVNRDSLVRHKKKCSSRSSSTEEFDSGSDMLAQFNSQFQSICSVMTAFMNAQTMSQANQSALMMEQTKTLMEVIKASNNALTVPNRQNNMNYQNIINNNTLINEHKSFNLNVFLNETCKNAINLTDFIDEIVVSIADLERTGELGYVGGISSLFIDRLNELDQENRPMHCSDSKRATLFVRNNNKWEREETARQLLTKAIKQLAMKSMKKIVEWQKLHPEYNDPESKQNDQYNTIMMNSMSGGTKEESESNYEKIFNNVVKNVVIDKKRIKCNT